MISFKELSKSGSGSFTVKDFIKENENILSEDELEYLSSLLEEILETGDTYVEFAFSLSHLCLIVRVFDLGKYSFIYPIELSERADSLSARDDAIEYAVKEEIEIVFTDVPKSEVPYFINDMRHLDIDAADPSAETFRVKVKTECELISDIPEYKEGVLSISALTEADVPLYASLSRDTETNKYWGYDFRLDTETEVCDTYFYENANLEFATGRALTVALRNNASFVGEAIYYAFNGRGGAEIAMRLLPEEKGKGLGKAFFAMLTEYARKIGLTRLFSTVDERNTASVAMFRKYMSFFKKDSGRVKFYLDLF